jgi:hypothetical protein
MKHLTTSTDPQTILMIPRSYGLNGTLILRDDSTNTETSNVVTLGKTGEYMSLEHSFSLTEGRYYDFRIEISGEIVYRDKIFCTDQDIDQETNDYYSVNEGEYTSENSFDNDYIIL